MTRIQLATRIDLIVKSFLMILRQTKRIAPEIDALICLGYDRGNVTFLKTLLEVVLLQSRWRA